MKYDVLKQLKWEDVQEIVEMADFALSTDGLPYPTPESYYTDVLHRLYDDSKIPASERYADLLPAAEKAVGCKMTNNRNHENILVRTFVSFILHNEGYSFSEIGRLMNRDHSSITHMYKRMGDMLSLPRAYGPEIDMFREFERLCQDLQCSQPSSQTTSASALAESPAR